MKSLLTFFLAFALSGAAAQAEMITVGAGTSTEARAWVDGPSEAAERVLIVHDYFGISESAMAEARYQASQGRRAMIVDLYDGATAEDDGQASDLMNGLDRNRAKARIAQALNELDGGKVSLRMIGFSMGGSLALEASALAGRDKVRSVALVYGGGYEAIPDELLSKAPPVFIATGGDDTWSAPALTALEVRLRKFGNPVEVLVLLGRGHGYAQSKFQKGANFNMDAMATTRSLIDNFAKRHP